MLRASFPYLAVLVGLVLLRNAWLSILSYHAFILLTLWRKPRPVKLRPLGARRIWIPSAFACVAAGGILLALWPFVSRGDEELMPWLAAHGLSGFGWIAFLPYFAFVHPLLEELHWRGLDDPSSGPFAWTDLAFAGYHALVLYPLLQPVWLILVFVVLGISSALWRAMSRVNRSLGFAVLTHVLADASVIAAAYIISRGS